MHTQDLSHLLASAERDLFKTEPRSLVQNEMRTIEQSNNQHLAGKELPDEMRTPTAEELEVMRNFAIEYKRANKNASKREIRKVTQKQFNIRVYR